MPARHTIKGRSKYGQPFVQLFLYMLQSPAWAALPPVDRAIYLHLAGIYNGSNNGSLGLSVRNAAEACNVNKDTAAKALIRLQEAGFIECSQLGAFGRKVRHSAEWCLTVHKNDRTGAPASKAFMRWRPA